MWSVTVNNLLTSRDVRPKIEVAYLSTKFILMDREKNIKLNGKKMTVIEFNFRGLSWNNTIAFHCTRMAPWVNKNKVQSNYCVLKVIFNLLYLKNYLWYMTKSIFKEFLKRICFCTRVCCVCVCVDVALRHFRIFYRFPYYKYHKKLLHSKFAINHHARFAFQNEYIIQSNIFLPKKLNWFDEIVPYQYLWSGALVKTHETWLMPQPYLCSWECQLTILSSLHRGV